MQGTSLWLLDYGADPSYQIDWADHVVPVAKGGASTLENGACTGWYLNYLKSDKEKGKYLFLQGRATNHFLGLPARQRAPIKQTMKRLNLIHYSDWFLNRSLWRLLLAVDHIACKRTRKRDAVYYCKASWNHIKTWRQIVAKESISSLEERRLVPEDLYDDQRIMLAMRGIQDVTFIRKAVDDLVPFYSANSIAFDTLEEIGDSDGNSAYGFWCNVEKNTLVTPQVKTFIRSRLQEYYDLS
jgi:hypothetical protein